MWLRRPVAAALAAVVALAGVVALAAVTLAALQGGQSVVQARHDFLQQAKVLPPAPRDSEGG